jgi:AAA family ATP:ADP antiporter
MCLFCILRLIPWARAQELKRAGQDGETPIGGSLLAAFRLVFSRPLLIALALFMVFGSSVGTMLYNAQASAVGAMHLDAASRTAYFADIDFGVNAVALTVQLLLTRVLLTRYGVAPMLIGAVVAMILGLGGLIFAFSVPLLAGVQIVTRGLSFSAVKPARESLFTLVDRESRYKAKNFIDTVVYRLADVLTSMSFAALVGVGLGLPALAGVWMGVAIIFGVIVLWVIRLQHKMLSSPPVAKE